MTRIYLPTTLADLATLQAEGELAVSVAHAVTPALREWYTEGDEEDLEYVAFTHAAGAALPLLHNNRAQRARRVVVSADVPQQQLNVAGEQLGTSNIRLNGSVPLSAVAAIHVDGDEAETAVIAARDAFLAATAGDPEAEFIVESVEDFELEWFDPTELGQLLVD